MSRLKRIFKSWAFPFTMMSLTLAGTVILLVVHRKDPKAAADYQTTLAFSVATLLNLTIAFAIRKGRLQALTILFLALCSIAAVITFTRLIVAGLTAS